LEERIAYVRPSITELEISKATEAARFGWGPSSNFYIREFEDNFARLIGSEFAVATSSCTGALHLGLAAVGVSEGDEVILADTNWVATLAPIKYLGAKPIFVDILEDTWCIDTSRIRSKITSKTKAIIATHLYGNLCEMNELLEIARENNLYLIEDSAEAIGSKFMGRYAGSIADFGVFSFHGSKTITTGEGGMLTTNNAQLADTVRTLNNHGRKASEPRQFWPSTLGYKYKMTNIQAAIGCAQLERFHELIERKKEIFRYYRDSLMNLQEVSLNHVQENCESGYWMPTAVFSKESGLTREKLGQLFEEANIDARVFFWPLSELDFNESANNLVARDLASRSINLPSYHDMSMDDQDRVVKVINKAVKGISSSQ
jgi:perosamine synthetase